MQRIAKNCAHWKDGHCETCGVQWQYCEVDAGFACPHFLSRAEPLRALTVWQPWASLIMCGCKPYEFRRWPLPAPYRGRRIVIHAAARKIDWDDTFFLLQQLERGMPSALGGGDVTKALDLLRPVLAGEVTLPRAAGLGTVLLGQPRRCVDIFGETVDGYEVDPDAWGWPVSDPQPFAAPIPARGAQGFWVWEPIPKGAML